MRPRRRTEIGQTQAGEGEQHGGEGGAIQQEGPARADGGDGEAGDGRADHPGGVERGRVERHRIVQVGLADQLRDEGLAHRRSKAAALPNRKAKI